MWLCEAQPSYAASKVQRIQDALYGPTMNVDGVVPARRYDDPDRDAHPGANQGQNSARGGQQSRGGGAADRAAGELMRESGIDPGSEVSRDELPF